MSLSGVFVDCIDRSGAVALIEDFIADGARHQVVTVNTDFVRLAESHPGYRDLLNEAALAVADGMPLVWLSRLAGNAVPERVAGIDLVDDCCRIASRAGVPVFLLGAAPGVAAAAGRALSARHAGLRVAGTFAPPFAPPSPDGDAEMVRLVQAVGRCVLFVAFGAPRQDEFIRAHLSEMDVAVAMGVGGTLDILAGNIRRAPAWMQRRGLEWVWRLSQEPRRLWRRYLLEDIPFLARFAMRIARGTAPAMDTR